MKAPLKSLVAVSLFLFLGSLAQAQFEPRPRSVAPTQSRSGSDWTENLFSGGDLGLTLSSNFVFVRASPILGYRINEVLSAGTGFTYVYYKQKFYDNGNLLGQVEGSIYGPKFFASALLSEQFFVYSELEHLNLKVLDEVTFEEKRIWNPHLWLGAGYRSYVGASSAVDLMLMYNVIYNRFSLGPNQPIIRIRFVQGI